MSADRLPDSRLRDAYTRAVEARQGSDRGACASADALLALVRREGSEESRLLTLDHVMTCPACRREFELLRAIDRAGSADARRGVASLRWRRAATIALAASAVLAISLGPGRRLWRDDGDTLVRGGDAGVTLLEPKAADVVSVSGFTFIWHAVPTARRYTVELLAPDGAVVLSRETADTALTLPASRDLRVGSYRWWVTAHTEEGTRLRSETRPLTIREP